MIVTKITNFNTTNDYDSMTIFICTDDEKNIDISIPTLLLTKPCGLSFLCLLSLMIYTLIKLYLIINEYREIFIPKSSS